VSQSLAPPKGSGFVNQVLTWVEKTKAWFMARVWPWALAHPKPATALAAVGGVGLLAYVGGNIIINGLIAGVLVSGGLGVLIWKLKSAESRPMRQVYNTMVGHPFATDLVLSGVAFMLSPGGITGWIAAAIAGLIASVWLAGAVPVSIKEAETDVVDATAITVPAASAAMVGDIR
jgi:hypothetical protein